MDAVTLALAKAKTAKLENTILEEQEVTISWDGDITGRDMVQEGNTGGIGWCRVSSRTPSAEELEAAVISGKGLDGELSLNDDNMVPESHYFNDDVSYCLWAFVTYKDNVTLRDGTIVPKPGTYLIHNIRAWGNVVTVTRLTYTTKVIKQDRVPQPVVFDLDAMGIDVQSLVLAGGGTATIDASEIFNTVQRGNHYLFRGSFAGTTVDILPSFYQWNTDGSLECIGFAIAVFLESFMQIHYVMSRDHIDVVITPLGA